MLRFLHSVLALLLLVVPTVPTAAQPAQMARDIRTQPWSYADFFTGPSNLLRLGDHLYFQAEDGLHGRELWRTDGTAAGTTLVRDICPGECNGLLRGLGAVAGGLIYFSADDGVHGIEPWVSDGTREGTRLLLDIHPELSSTAEWFTPFGDSMAFTALDPEHGREPWISDGTAAGTHLLADLNLGADDSTPTSMLSNGSLLFFDAFDADHGREPWVSDGSEAGTVRLGDLMPGPDSSTFEELYGPQDWPAAAVSGGLYYFSAADPDHGSELWKSDGTSVGTVLVQDLVPGPKSAVPTDLTTFGNEVFFRAGYLSSSDLWKSDGTASGTVQLTTGEVGPNSLTPVGSKLFFGARTAAAGREPWLTDGTVAGTHMLADLRPGPEDSADWSGGFAEVALLNAGRFVFPADDGVHGTELWVSDGTAPGTFMLADVASQELDSLASRLIPQVSRPTPLGDELVFFAWSDVLGYEPWATDGTPAGTRMIRNIDDQASSVLPFLIWPDVELAAAGQRLFFNAWDDEHGGELWSSRGTPGTTELVEDIQPDDNPLYSSSIPSAFAALGDVVLFEAGNGAWRSDGNAGGTFPLGITGGLLPLPTLTAADGEVFIQTESGYWASDGSVAGTRLVSGVEGGASPAALAGTVYFAGTAASVGSELFRLDATHDHAELVADLVPGAESSTPRHLVAQCGRLLFAATTPGVGTEIWWSDGTAGNTHLLVDLRPGPASSIDPDFGNLGLDSPQQLYGKNQPPLLVPSGPRTFFPADDGVHGREPWVTDGTAAGTHLALDVHPGPLGSAPRWLTDVAGVLYFSADDGVHGRELWASDGTAPGTRLVADHAPGADASSLPHFLVDADGVLYFSAFTPEHGVELWRLAGGVPELAADVLPGAESSSPSYLTVSGRRLFFFASDGVHGYELWSLVLPSRKLRATLTGSGRAIPGHSVFLNVVLTNPTPLDQPDAQGDEFRLPIPGELTPLSVQATAGLAKLVGAGGSPLVARSARAQAAASTVDLIWNGALAAGASVTITVEERIETTLPEGVLLQGEIFFDTDGDEINDLSTLTDDPLLPGDEDPSRLFAPQSALEIPTLAAPGLLLLVLLLAGLAVHRLRGAG